MGKAFKCDFTGVIAEGSGLAFVDVPLDETRMLRVSVFVKEARDRQVQGVLGPDAAKTISDALSGLKPAKPVAKG